MMNECSLCIKDILFKSNLNHSYIFGSRKSNNVNLRKHFFDIIYQSVQIRLEYFVHFLNK